MVWALLETEGCFFVQDKKKAARPCIFPMEFYDRAKELPMTTIIMTTLATLTVATILAAAMRARQQAAASVRK